MFVNVDASVIIQRTARFVALVLRFAESRVGRRRSSPFCWRIDRDWSLVGKDAVSVTAPGASYFATDHFYAPGNTRQTMLMRWLGIETVAPYSRGRSWIWKKILVSYETLPWYF